MGWTAMAGGERGGRTGTPLHTPQSSLPTTPATCRERSVGLPETSDLAGIEVALDASPRKRRKRRSTQSTLSKSVAVVVESEGEEPAVGEKCSPGEGSQRQKFDASNNNSNPHASSSTTPRRRREDRDDHLRTVLTTPDAVNAFLASKWIHIPELQRLEELGIVQYKRGKYLEAERAAIRMHLVAFQREHRVSDEGLLEYIMGKGRFVERSPHPSFWFDTAATVPGRPVAYVRDAVKRMYDPRGRKGLWTVAEDQALLKAYAAWPDQWRQISDQVERSELDCRDRWKHELRDRATRRVGAWSADEVDSLVQVVENVASAVGLDPLEPGLPWDKISEAMGRTRTTAQCRKKWWAGGCIADTRRDHLIGTGELALPQPRLTRERRLDPKLVVQRFRELGVRHENDIVWADLPTEEWKVTPARLRAAWCTMKSGVKGSFEEVLSRLGEEDQLGKAVEEEGKGGLEQEEQEEQQSEPGWSFDSPLDTHLVHHTPKVRHTYKARRSIRS